MDRGAGGDDDGPVQDVTITEEPIRLSQFLKLAGLVDSGSDVRPLLEGGEVSVNRETETRRGRRLVRGDVVELGGDEFRVA